MADNRTATVEITASSRNLSNKLREARSKFSSFLGEQRKAFGKFASGAGASFAGNMGANVASRGLDFLVQGAQDAAAFNESLQRFGTAADQTPEQLQALAKATREVNLEVGIGRDQLLAGAAQYVALTGRGDEAAASIRTFGMVAQASNSKLEDIAATGASLRENLKIDPKDFEAAFSSLIVQGKAGSIELRDLATELSSVAPSFAQFAEGSGLKGMQEMGAALQIVRKGFGSASEASTGMRALMVSINRNAEKFQKVGIQIYDKDPKTGVKTLRNFSQIVQAISESDLAKDPTKLTKAFGSDEAKRAFDQLSQNRDLMADLLRKSQDAGVVQRDLGKYLQSDAGKTKLAWEAAKIALADAFTPERIAAFSQALIAAAQVVGKIVDGISAAMGIAEKAGRGLAMIVGGKSWEDQVTAVQNDHEDERRAIIRAQLMASGRSGLAFDNNYVEKQIKKENMFKATLGVAGDVTMAGGDSDFEADRKVRGMNIAEYYSTMKNSSQVKNASDSYQMQMLIDRAMAAAFAADITKRNAEVVVKIGESEVVRAQRKGKDHRRRPGG